MKKFFILFLSLFLTGCGAFADSYMPLPEAVNSRMFSTDGSRPLENLERTYYTNQAIRQIEAKQKPQQQEEQIQEIQQPETKKKTGFRDLFKGFVIEY